MAQASLAAHFTVLVCVSVCLPLLVASASPRARRVRGSRVTLDLRRPPPGGSSRGGSSANVDETRDRLRHELLQSLGMLVDPGNKKTPPGDKSSCTLDSPDDIQRMLPGRFLSEDDLMHVLPGIQSLVPSRSKASPWTAQRRLVASGETRAAGRLEQQPAFTRRELSAAIFSGGYCAQCMTEIGYEIVDEVKDFAGRNHTIINLSNAFQFIPAGRCLNEGTPCGGGGGGAGGGGGEGGGPRCAQMTRAHWSLVWTTGVGVNIVAHEVPSHCQCLNLGVASSPSSASQRAQHTGVPPASRAHLVKDVNTDSQPSGFHASQAHLVKDVNADSQPSGFHASQAHLVKDVNADSQHSGFHASQAHLVKDANADSQPSGFHASQAHLVKDVNADSQPSGFHASQAHLVKDVNADYQPSGFHASQAHLVKNVHADSQPTIVHSSQAHSEKDTMADSRSENGTGTDTGLGTILVTGTGTDTGDGAVIVTGTGTDMGNGAVFGTGIGTDKDTGAVFGTSIGTGTDNGAVFGTGTGTVKDNGHSVVLERGGGAGTGHGGSIAQTDMKTSGDTTVGGRLKVVGLAMEHTANAQFVWLKADPSLDPTSRPVSDSMIPIPTSVSFSNPTTLSPTSKSVSNSMIPPLTSRSVSHPTIQSLTSQSVSNPMIPSLTSQSVSTSSLSYSSASLSEDPSPTPEMISSLLIDAYTSAPLSTNAESETSSATDMTELSSVPAIVLPAP